MPVGKEDWAPFQIEDLESHRTALMIGKEDFLMRVAPRADHWFRDQYRQDMYLRGFALELSDAEEVEIWTSLKK